ncbi:MAG: beta-ketoacyl-[acyl-carrier-protein] synthase family protein [Bacteroidales bacterium]|nr:beta-ketoacyl-[acyl-carrier-protein] synthase family protein [Bacteroidales bacterium]
MDRVLVTGLGAVSALGLSVEDNLAALRAGRSGIVPSPGLVKTNLRLPVGEVPLTMPELAGMLGIASDMVMTRTALMAALAASEAMADAGLGARCPDGRFELSGESTSDGAPGRRIGLVLGTSVGGMDISGDFYEEYRRDHSAGDIRAMLSHDCGASTAFVAGYLGIDGFTTTISTACSSAGNAIMLGARMIRAGLLDIAVVGGSDALSRFTMNGFNSLRILSSSVCRPFDVSRDGLNLGEGAGLLVLESESSASSRGCQGYCAVTGWANVNEAFHQTASSPDGDGAFAAMSEAMAVAGMVPADVDYINTHGTATPGNDLSEGKAIRRMFGAEVPPFGSFKGYIGHTLAASEGIEAVLCARAISDGELWPSLGFSAMDPEICLEPLMAHCHGIKIRNILSNSFGFGGNDSSLVFSAL